MPPAGSGACVVTTLRSFQTSEGKLIKDEAEDSTDCLPLTHVFRDGRIGCIVRGDTIVEVLSLVTGNLIGCKKFDKEIRDPGSKVTCVEECWFGNRVSLLVGMETSAGAGILCVFNFFLSRVIQIIELPQRVSALEVVCTACGDSAPGWAICEQLRHFCGVVAVGTVTGHVYFLDLCLDEFWEPLEEPEPVGLCIISPRTKDVAAKRLQIIRKGQRLCMPLDEASHHRSSFVYRKPDDSAIKKFLAEEVSVTCLQYIPQTGKLAVGFSFGGYQLWQLYNPVLEYSCRLEGDLCPVTHFAHQEPENDPKNFCYLWVGRSSLPSDADQELIASVCLYQLAYSNKEWYEGYGTFYKDLLSVCLRFDLDLTADPFSPQGQDIAWSRLLGCYTIQDHSYDVNKETDQEESFEDSMRGPDLSLCAVVWEAQENGSSSNTRCHLGLFDMNRWYHAQMPASLRFTGSMELCSYFAFYSLDPVVDTVTPDNLLSVHVGYESLRKFINNAPLPPEQHFYPSSLAFEAKCVLTTGVVCAQYQGNQRQVLMRLQQQGPACLLVPTAMFNLCVYAGLLPRSLTATSQQPDQQRRALLTLCLEYNLISFIKTCIAQWADGDFTPQGCTLKFLLDWAWNKVSHIKDTIDKTCMPLYDCSGMPVDLRLQQTLHQCQQQLSHMPAILNAFLLQSSPITQQGMEELKARLSVVELILQQLTVVLWFLHRGLLPENDEVEDETREGQYMFPASSLIMAFNIRRGELKKIHSNVGETDLLMIDGLTQHMGPSLSQLWDDEGGNGRYPPPNLHALINMYLLEDIPVLEKHCVVLYLLLDLISLGGDGEGQFAEKISRFGQAMFMPEGVIRLVQGFWMLDHQDFQEAETYLTYPTVDCDLGPWQRSRIVKALLYQGKSKLALRYMRSRKLTSTGPEDIKLQLTVLLANRLTAKAWEYQRQCRDESNQQELLYHLFHGCQQTKTFVHLLELPLSEIEELHLVEYLQDSTEPNSLETLVMYYLQRGRYIEGIRLNQKLEHRAMGASNPRARERAPARNALVSGYLNILPAAQRKLVFETLPSVKEHKTVSKVVTLPKPLSTLVSRSGHANVVSQATIIQAVMEKVHEFADIIHSDSPLVKRSDRKDEDIGPFINTPVTPMAEGRISHNQSIVYPRVDMSALEQPAQAEAGEESTLYPWKQLSDVSMETYDHSPIKGFVAKRRLSKYLNASALSLLKTPPVKRKASRPSSGTSSAHPTPQSILKVRKMVQLSPSPKILSASSSAERLAQALQSESPMKLPVPKKLSLTDVGPSPRTSRSSVGTPKHLRFADNVKSASPSPVLPGTLNSPERSLSGQPSARDRSPTPDKHPQWSGKVVDHTAQRSPAVRDQDPAEEAIDVDVEEEEEEITFNYSKSQLAEHEVEGDEDMAVDDVEGKSDEEGEDVDMEEEPCENEGGETVGKAVELEDQPARVTSSSILEPKLSSSSRQMQADLSSALISGRMPIRSHASSESVIEMSTSFKHQTSRVSFKEEIVDNFELKPTRNVHSDEESSHSEYQDGPKDKCGSEQRIVHSEEESSHPECPESFHSTVKGEHQRNIHSEEESSHSEHFEMIRSGQHSFDSDKNPSGSELLSGSIHSKQSQSSASQLSVLHQAAAALSKLDTPDPSPVTSPLHTSLSINTEDVTADSRELSLRLQMTPTSPDESSIEPRPALPQITKTSPKQVSPMPGKEPLTVDTSQSLYSLPTEQISPSRRSGRLQARQSKESQYLVVRTTTTTPSPSKTGHVTPQGSPHRSASSPEVLSDTSTARPSSNAPVTPDSAVSAPASPRSVSSLQSSPVVGASARSRRSTKLSVSQARLEHLDTAEGHQTRSRASRSVSPLVEEPTTPTRASTRKTRGAISVSDASSMITSDTMETTSEVTSEMTSESDLETGHWTRSRSTVSSVVELPTTPTRGSSRKTRNTSVSETSSVMTTETMETTSEMTSESDLEKIQAPVSAKKTGGRRSSARTPAAPLTPTRQSSRLRDKEAKRLSADPGTPPASPAASPRTSRVSEVETSSTAKNTASKTTTPRRSPGRSPGRAAKSSAVKTTIKSTRIKELQSEEAMVTDFKFSEPVHLERENSNDGDRPSTPSHSFIFSPPLTRSQIRLASVDRTSDVSSEAGVIPPPPEPSTPVVVKKTPSRKGRKKKDSIPHCSPTNSPLNLLSPYVTSVVSTATTNTKSTTVQSQGKKYLRPRKKYGGRVW